MPLALLPSETVDVVLEIDKATPPDDRPTFVARFLTAKDWLAVSKLAEEADAAKTDEEAHPLLMKALGTIITDWRNMGDRSFSPNAIAEVLTVREMWELLISSRKAINLSEAEKKRLQLQKQSDPAGSATSVVPASA